MNASNPQIKTMTNCDCFPLEFRLRLREALGKNAGEIAVDVRVRSLSILSINVKRYKGSYNETRRNKMKEHDGLRFSQSSPP